MEGRIDITKLTLEELVGVVNLYPWYGGARKELCIRMSRMGDAALEDRQFMDAAMHMPSRRVVADIVRTATGCELVDADAEDLARSYAEEQKREEAASRRVYAGVGDYFSQEEYDQGHIPGAIVLPYDEVLERAEGILTDKNQLILVYCRSGRRSKIAADDLVKLGYTNIREFGGIIDWPYEVE